MNGFSDLIHAYWKTQMLEGSVIHFDELFTLVSNPKLRDSFKMMILEMTNTHTMAVVTPKL
ncbi:MAG: GNAT family N-acetyltransferase, partial [Flavobacterium sp.]